MPDDVKYHIMMQGKNALEEEGDKEKHVRVWGSGIDGDRVTQIHENEMNTKNGWVFVYELTLDDGSVHLLPESEVRAVRIGPA